MKYRRLLYLARVNKKPKKLKLLTKNLLPKKFKQLKLSCMDFR